MKILVLNSGSSSLKFQLFDMINERVLAKGIVERIGLGNSSIVFQPLDQEKVIENTNIADHQTAVQYVLNLLVNAQYGIITSFSEINAIGHRVAHGGSLFKNSVIINTEVKAKIKSLSDIAPLHNPPALIGIEACEKVLPGITQVAVFDTAFHQTIPDYAYLYGLPYEVYEKYGIRKYGFHGTSHKYVANRAADLLGKPIEELKIITCHLGNGASITAVLNGKSVETSMGFTPLEGLMMGTRSGDIDPTIVTFLNKKAGWSVEETFEVLNKKSGILGVSGVSSDFRDVEDAAAGGNKRAQVALEIFYHDVIKYIGAYVAVLNGVDAIVFTAGLGENSPSMRSAVCKNLTYLGAQVDEEMNSQRGKEIIISTKASDVAVLVIPTNEELMIARDTKQLLITK